MKKLICTILALVMALSFAGCKTSNSGAGGTPSGSTPSDPTPSQTQNDPTESTEIVLNQVVYWNMHIAQLDSNGNVLETGEITAKTSFSPCSDYQYNCSFSFRYQDAAYTLSGAVRMEPKEPDSGKYSYDFPSGTQYKDDDTKGKMFYMGLVPDQQCFILDVDDGKDVYLIGYTDPNADIAALWEYFQGFIENRPAEFPQIVG
jgi:hypothetical protein